MNDALLTLALAAVMVAAPALISLRLQRILRREPIEVILEVLSWLAAVALVAVVALSLNV